MDSNRSAADAAPSLGAIDSARLTRHEVVATLPRAEPRYRSISENRIEGAFQMTPNGRYLRANPALTLTHAYNPATPCFAAVYRAVDRGLDCAAQEFPISIGPQVC